MQRLKRTLWTYLPRRRERATEGQGERRCLLPQQKAIRLSWRRRLPQRYEESAESPAHRNPTRRRQPAQEAWTYSLAEFAASGEQDSRRFHTSGSQPVPPILPSPNRGVDFF